MRRRLLLAAPLVASALPGCALFRRPKPPPPPALVHYVLGPAYEADGVWRYPRENFDLDETGLASVLGAHPPLCTDGAAYDPQALIAAHPTLQLPCVARITDLLSGRQVTVRIDDRGPASPARALALSPRAAALLAGGEADAAGRPVLRVRIEVLEAPSQAILAGLSGVPSAALPIAAAPTGTVKTEQLAPPPGAEGSAGALPAASTTAAAPAVTQTVPARLPEIVTAVSPQPGQLFVACGAFSRPRFARLLASRMPGLGAVVDTDYAASRDRAYRVRIGPLSSVAEADATLDRALRAGVVDARIVVES